MLHTVYWPSREGWVRRGETKWTAPPQPSLFSHWQPIRENAFLFFPLAKAFAEKPRSFTKLQKYQAFRLIYQTQPIAQARNSHCHLPETSLWFLRVTSPNAVSLRDEVWSWISSTSFSMLYKWNQRRWVFCVSFTPLKSCVWAGVSSSSGCAELESHVPRQWVISFTWTVQSVLAWRH